MWVNNLPKVATQCSGATRDSNRGRRVVIPSALTTTPPSHSQKYFRNLFTRIVTLHTEKHITAEKKENINNYFILKYYLLTTKYSFAFLFNQRTMLKLLALDTAAAACPSLPALKLYADMQTFENQKEESLTTEARSRADNRGPTIEARRADKLKSS